MAENEETLNEPQSSGRKSSRMVTFGIVVAVMLAEGGAIFFAVKMMYQRPDSVMASEGQNETMVADVDREVEINLPEMNAFSRRQGRLMMYSLEITLRVDRKKEDAVRKVVGAREGTIMDRINTVIRAADSDLLSEPGLDALREQFKQELDRILGDPELIKQVLVRRFYQSPADL